MKTVLNPPLVARNDRRLKVLGICRISTTHQDRRSLADQEALYRKWSQEHTDIPFDLIVLAEQGSGESLERKDYLRAIELVESRTIDLVITEDMARICRRVHAHLFCETCEDCDTRLISLHDHIDTRHDEWRLHSFFAVMQHENANKLTSNRIRRSQCNRFVQGGVFQCTIYGYIKPPDAKSDSAVHKDPKAEPIYEDWFRRLESGATFAEISDWLNQNSVPTGAYCRSKTWTGTMVGRITRNTILKGERYRNEKISRRVNKTGVHRSFRAPPEERLTRDCPHLAFIEPARYDRVMRLLRKKYAKFTRTGVNGSDTRKYIPRKQTTWPGQHLRCGVCGRLLYWSGLKNRNKLMCSGACSYQCWNSVTPDGPLVIEKLIQAIASKLQELPDFDACAVSKLTNELEKASQESQTQNQALEARRDEIRRQIDKVTDAIADMGGSKALLEKLGELENAHAEVLAEIDAIDQQTSCKTALPSAADIRRAAADLFTAFDPDNPEVGRLMQRLIPDLRVHPVRLCDDSGAVVLRAKFTLHLVALTTRNLSGQRMDEVLRIPLVVDLFNPPLRVKHLDQIMSMRAQGMKGKEIAAALRITRTDVISAVALDGYMKRA
jgi:site-specific DNA recombinase